MGYYNQTSLTGDTDNLATAEQYARRWEQGNEACMHPVTRQYAWHAYDGTLVLCCCDCGAVLMGAAELA